MIDLKKYGLLYRLNCLRDKPVIEGNDAELWDIYVTEGLVDGSLPRQSAAALSIELTSDGHLLIHLIRRQIRFSISSVLPKPSINTTYELQIPVLEQE